MVRTIVSLDEDDKRWLDETAERDGVPMTELIRRSVKLLRAQRPAAGRSLDDILELTAGMWQEGDGLEYQKRLRREW